MFPSKISKIPADMIVRVFAIGFLLIPLQGSAMTSELSPQEIADIQSKAGVEYGVHGRQAENPALDWRINFRNDAVEISGVISEITHPLKFKLARIGNRRELAVTDRVAPEIAGNRVSYRHRNIEEWYVNGTLGLEQGFTVPQSLGNELVLELETNWLAESQDRNIRLTGGNQSWTYGALYATDADGKALPSAMRVENGRIRVEVSTARARFPVIIDPVITKKAVLTAKDQSAFLGFGRSVALSGDGNTAIVGSDNNAAYIYKRSPTGWSQVQKLVKPAGLRCNSNGSWFGWSVAISKDGSTAMVGASGIFVFYSGIIPIHLFYSCADMPVYRKQGTQWVLDKILTATGVTPESMFGSSVSLSQDGNRAIVGAQLTKCTAVNDRCGAVYFFERGASGWANPKKVINSTTYDAQSGYFGATTAMSGDGTWALVGAPGGDTAWAFQRQAAPTGWKQIQTIKFAASRLTKDFGTAMALSAAGDRAVITAESTTNVNDCKGDYNDCGAAYTFRRTGSVWGFESVFTANDSHSFNYFGESVTMSGDGQRIVVGTGSADCVNGNCGAAYLFGRVGTAWLQQGRVTGPSAGLGGTDLGGDFGGAVSLGQGGANLLVAARRDNCVAGKECGKVYHYAIGK